jgi:hypothetical protein
VNALSHLSPDVLEVVRDVARQEDSFLLRVQGVPLAAFTNENAPRLGPRAPFLSSAERHILEYCRDETAYLFELALFFALTRDARAESVRSAASSELASAFANTFTAVRAPTDGSGHPSLLIPSALADMTSPDDLVQLGWRTLARISLALRVDSATLSNVALGSLRTGDLISCRRALQRNMGLQPKPQSDVHPIVGHERFLSGSFQSAAAAYSLAWQASRADGHAACALLNHGLAGTRPNADLSNFALALEGERLALTASWLRRALQSHVNAEVAQRVLDQSRRLLRTHSTHPSTRLVTELLQ